MSGIQCSHFQVLAGTARIQHPVTSHLVSGIARRSLGRGWAHSAFSLCAGSQQRSRPPPVPGGRREATAPSPRAGSPRAGSAAAPGASRGQRCAVIDTRLSVQRLPARDVPAGDYGTIVIRVAPEKEGEGTQNYTRKAPETRQACGAGKAWCHHGHSLQIFQYQLQV